LLLLLLLLLETFVRLLLCVVLLLLGGPEILVLCALEWMPLARVSATGIDTRPC
jgi:hypothetical protein